MTTQILHSNAYDHANPNAKDHAYDYTPIEKT